MADKLQSKQKTVAEKTKEATSVQKWLKYCPNYLLHELQQDILVSTAIALKLNVVKISTGINYYPFITFQFVLSQSLWYQIKLSAFLHLVYIIYVLFIIWTFRLFGFQFHAYSQSIHIVYTTDELVEVAVDVVITSCSSPSCCSFVCLVCFILLYYRH